MEHVSDSTFAPLAKEYDSCCRFEKKCQSAESTSTFFVGQTIAIVQGELLLAPKSLRGRPTTVTWQVACDSPEHALHPLYSLQCSPTLGQGNHGTPLPLTVRVWNEEETRTRYPKPVTLAFDIPSSWTSHEESPHCFCFQSHDVCLTWEFTVQSVFEFESPMHVRKAWHRERQGNRPKEGQLWK